MRRFKGYLADENTNPLVPFYIRALSTLLNAGIDPNEDYWTSQWPDHTEVRWTPPIHTAARTLVPEFIQMLLCAGADPYFTKGNGETALDSLKEMKKIIKQQAQMGQAHPTM